MAPASCASRADSVQGDEKAQKKFQEVSEAYDTLKDSKKRSLYDRVGPEGMDNMGGFGGGQGFQDAQGFGVGVCIHTVFSQPQTTKICHTR